MAGKNALLLDCGRKMLTQNSYRGHTVLTPLFYSLFMVELETASNASSACNLATLFAYFIKDLINDLLYCSIC